MCQVRNAVSPQVAVFRYDFQVVEGQVRCVQEDVDWEVEGKLNPDGLFNEPVVGHAHDVAESSVSALTDLADQI